MDSFPTHNIQVPLSTDITDAINMLPVFETLAKLNLLCDKEQLEFKESLTVCSHICLYILIHYVYNNIIYNSFQNSLFYFYKVNTPFSLEFTLTNTSKEKTTISLFYSATNDLHACLIEPNQGFIHILINHMLFFLLF